MLPGCRRSGVTLDPRASISGVAGIAIDALHENHGGFIWMRLVWASFSLLQPSGLVVRV